MHVKSPVLLPLTCSSHLHVTADAFTRLIACKAIFNLKTALAVQS